MAAGQPARHQTFPSPGRSPSMTAAASSPELGRPLPREPALMSNAGSAASFPGAAITRDGPADAELVLAAQAGDSARLGWLLERQRAALLALASAELGYR